MRRRRATAPRRSRGRRVAVTGGASLASCDRSFERGRGVLREPIGRTFSGLDCRSCWWTAVAAARLRPRAHPGRDHYVCARVRDRREHRRPRRTHGSGDGRDAAPPRPRRRRRAHRSAQRRDDRHAAAGDHRHRGGPPAAEQRGRVGVGGVQRLHLQPREAPRGPARPRPSLRHAHGHGGARAPLRGVRRRAGARARGDVRVRDLGRKGAAAAARARPLRREAAVRARVAEGSSCSPPS